MATGKTAGGAFELHIKSDPELKDVHFRIERFAKELDDLRPVFLEAEDWFKGEMGAAFESEGSFTGARWVRLTEPYRAWKQRHYPNRKIGHLTGALIGSLTGGGGYAHSIKPRSAWFGQSDNALALPYARAFAERRPVLRFKRAHRVQLQKRVQGVLVGMARDNFGGPYLPKQVARPSDLQGVLT